MTAGLTLAVLVALAVLYRPFVLVAFEGGAAPPRSGFASARSSSR